MTVTDAATGPVETPEALSAALFRADPQLADLMAAEAERRAETIQLLAGENLTGPAVLAALTGPLIDKYAEGYPGRRHHAGCSLADAAELLAIDRARELFAAPHANVQPRSVTAAMLAAYAALLRPGDVVLAMSLEHGGHLSCGSRANFSGRWFDFVGYGVRREDGLIDLDQVRELALKHRPKAIVVEAPSPTRGTPTGPPSGRSPTRRTPIWWPPSRRPPAWSRPVSRRPRCRTRTSPWRPPTSCSGARAAVCCCAPPNWPTGSTGRSSRSARAAPR